VTTASTAAGVACALAAGVLFEFGYVEQAGGTRESTDARLTSLVVRPRWLRGTGMVVAGLVLQLVALALAPIGVVQPVLVLGLAALVVLSERRLGEPVTIAQRWAVAAAALAVVLIVAGGPSEDAHGAVHSAAAFSIVGVVFAAGLLGGRLDPRGWVLAAGVGEAGAVLAAKLALTAFPDVLPTLGWAALAGVTALVALQAEMASLRTLRVALVGPLVLVGRSRSRRSWSESAGADPRSSSPGCCSPWRPASCSAASVSRSAGRRPTPRWAARRSSGRGRRGSRTPRAPPRAARRDRRRRSRGHARRTRRCWRGCGRRPSRRR
jgi:hypothetical protein